MNINECGCRPYGWLGLDGNRCIRVIPRHIYQGLNKILNQKPGQQTNDLTTLLIGPTGKAAHNIKGHTIHAAFHVPANQSLMNYSKLSWDNLNSYCSKYLNLKWIICDEISMVSNYMLKFIHL